MSSEGLSVEIRRAFATVKERAHSMRLRTKFVTVTIFILALTLGLCCVFMVTACKKTIIQDAVTYTVQENKQLNDLLTAKIAKLYSVTSKSVQKTGIKYYFADFAASAAEGSEYVLLSSEDTLFNNSGIAAGEVVSRAASSYQTEEGIEIRYMVIHSNGNDYCVAGQEAEFFEELYTVGVVRDITERMDMVRTFTLRCILICSAIFGFAIFLMMLFLTKALKPIEILNKNARNIAGGDYTGRIHLKSTDELGILADSFNSMAESVQQHIKEVEATAEEKNMLLHAMAHEMRTPVTAISGYAYALQCAKLSDIQKEEAVCFIESESLRLERLMRKITELVHMDDAKPEIKEIQAAELFERFGMILKFNRKMQKNSVTFSYNDQAVIYGDSDLLLMLLTNLVDNAKKAGAEEIMISYQEGILSVSDNGAGIPAEQIEKIMQPFYQGDVSRNQEGFGLGLALCQRIAKLHGSELQVESVPGQGSRFFMDGT